MRAIGEMPYRVCYRQLISFSSQQSPATVTTGEQRANLTPMPHESVDERRSRELVKLLRKLRWIGKDDEAKELELKLHSALAGDCVPAAPSDTD
jgi:hypothetical protein